MRKTKFELYCIYTTTVTYKSSRHLLKLLCHIQSIFYWKTLVQSSYGIKIIFITAGADSIIKNLSSKVKCTNALHDLYIFISPDKSSMSNQLENWDKINKIARQFAMFVENGSIIYLIEPKYHTGSFSQSNKSPSLQLQSTNNLNGRTLKVVCTKSLHTQYSLRKILILLE